MARRKGKQTGLGEFEFGRVDPYGRQAKKDAALQIQYVDLEKLRPDPDQPRRLLPLDLAEGVWAGRIGVEAAVEEWIERAAAETADTALKHEVEELRKLAHSIEQHGLINPVTIRPCQEVSLPEVDYLIVTGERRYWAHVLLRAEGRPIHEGKETRPADAIKALVSPEGVSVRAHQLIENLMREDMNAVEKARGLWALRYELSGVTYRLPGVKERDLVTWNSVSDSMGISKQHRIRITSVLRLSDEAQRLIDQYNLAEATIRPVVEKLKKHPDLQLKALRQLIAWQEAEARGEGEGRRIVPSVRAYVDKLLKKAEASARPARPAGLDVNKLRQRVRGTVRYMQRLDHATMLELSRLAENETGADIVEDLHALRAEIDGLLAALSEK